MFYEINACKILMWVPVGNSRLGRTSFGENNIGGGWKWFVVVSSSSLWY
jgi:hypothetical protein